VYRDVSRLNLKIFHYAKDPSREYKRPGRDLKRDSIVLGHTTTTAGASQGAMSRETILRHRSSVQRLVRRLHR